MHFAPGSMESSPAPIRIVVVVLMLALLRSPSPDLESASNFKYNVIEMLEYDMRLLRGPFSKLPRTFNLDAIQEKVQLRPRETFCKNGRE